MPCAIGITWLHWPEAHRWKLEPLMQFQAPSSVQAPVCVPVTVPVGVGCETTVVEVATGTEVVGTEVAEDTGTEDTEAEDAGAEDEVAVIRVVGTSAPPVVKKTPPVGVLERIVSLDAGILAKGEVTYTAAAEEEVAVT